MLDSSITTFFEHDSTKLLWLTHVTSDGKVYYITSDLTRSEYQLWNGKKQTKYTSDNPLDLYARIKDKGEL